MITRSKEIQGFLDNFSKKAFGKTSKEAEEEKKCLYCGKKIKEFRDELSIKEYNITGMCQKCQDEMFEGGENDN